uniref:TRASH domain-containing protein n=1 Tax=Iconisemion striatum TaxID=60296 RepID=A0A1A7YL86_9TELE
MADSEEFRLKRLKHEEQMSRMFDEVMGLGDFADSSRGSVASSKSGGQTEAKGLSETSGLKEIQPRDEDSSCSRREEKMDEGTGEINFPRHTSSSSNQPSLFNLGGGVGGSGEAAFDDALDGLPLYEQEEEDEDWHFALPMDSMEDGDARKTKATISQFGPKNQSPRGGPFPRKPADEEEEQQEREGSGDSANTSHSSQDNTPDDSRDVLNQTEETEDSQQVETPEAPPAEDSNPPASPGVKIKDEPIDEGYDAALLPQSSIRQIKQELEQQEEELRISSVYSVGGANTFVSPAMPATIPAPTPTAIFIPGRGAVLQAMAPLPIRPPALIQPPVPTLSVIPPRPPQPPAPGSVRCSGCTKVLLKGQTAFQRKGSTQLFCSTSCLTGHLPPATKYRSCFQCNREILQPRDMVTIPGEENTYLQFCGQFCLSVFRHKRIQVDKMPDKRPGRKPQKPPEKPVERQPEKPFCSVCKTTKKQIEHEVNHQGRLHKLCSNACFLAWRKLRQLAMNCCEGCGLYCNSNSGSCQTITIEKTQLNFCSPTCVGTYKLTCRKMTECPNCRKSVMASCSIMERDQKGKVQLYCTTSCVEQSRPPQHALIGTPFPCCLCKVSAIPQYHLAMVDGTIRNFCSYNCVSMFRKSGHVLQPELTNGTSSLRDPPIKDAPRPAPSASSVPPVPQDYPSSVPSHHSAHTSVPPLVPPSSVTSSPTVPGQVQAHSPPDETQKPTAGGVGDAVKVTCHQCSKPFNTKPLLFSHQGRISVFCCKTCSYQYKTQKNIVASCESCKQEKVIYENFNYNQQDLFFCSENCKLLFKSDHQWRPCTYCSAIGDKMVLSHYGGKTEEFCKPHCMSQFTVLYYGMGRCDGCSKQGYMIEKLQCLGSVRNFCNMSCLLQYCYIHFEMSQHTSSNSTVPQMPCAPAQPHLSSKMNPVIGDVVSLANGSAAQPNVSADTSLSGALPASSVDGKNLDHASTQTDAMRVPAPRRRQMKNKSVLCRPFTLDQESTCQLLTVASESEATPKEKDDVKMVMVPVPVPVPVFIPVPVNIYPQHTPVSMVIPMPVPVPIVVSSKNKDTKDAEVQFEMFLCPEEEEKREIMDVSNSDQRCSSEDMKSEVICEDEEAPGEGDPPQTKFSETSDPQPEKSKTAECPPASITKDQPPSSPPMDLEADVPPESLNQKVTVQQRGVKRPRDGSYSRKRSRRRTGPAGRRVLAAQVTSKMNHLYGVKAWRSWVQQRNKDPQESSRVDIKEDILQCDSAELSFALSHFIREVRRPNGDTYNPDSIFYLCLGIQQYLFEQGRIENIFTDELYSQFASEISGMLQPWNPKLLPNGGAVPSRVEESYLWECKQLGAYSPIVLLNTLLFFSTKMFHLTTVAQHQRLSFSSLTLRSKPCSRAGKVSSLLYQGGGTATAGSEPTERIRRRPSENVRELELLENVANPLQCPVRLFEFYLSRCPESVKKRTDVFYLQPERSVHTDSSHWYTRQPLDSNTLQSMLTRILAVREVQQEAERCRRSAAAVDKD